MSPTTATKVSRRDEAHPGDGHQAADLLRGHRLAGQLALDQADLGVQEVDLAQAALERLALVGGKLERRRATDVPPCRTRLSSAGGP